MIIDLQYAPTIDTVRDYADDTVRSMHRHYGTTLDRSLESLKHIDRVLDEWRESGATADRVTKSLYAFGTYAGEVLREQEPGRWTEPPRDGHGDLDSLFLFVRLLDGREWRPIARVFDALEAPGQGVYAALKAFLGR